jgi:Fungal protein kinase
VTPFAPKLKLIDTHVNPDIRCDRLTPDLSIYPFNNPPEGDAKTDFSKMGLFVEFKPAESSDPFCDPPDGEDRRKFCFEKDTNDARLVRGQLVSYAAALAGRQFRVHTFCVLVCGTYARFIRWDRDGATVTERFNYIQQPHLLAGFFWRYNHLDPRQQGYDTSVSSIDTENSGIQQIHFETLQKKNPDHRKFCTLTVPDRANAEDEKQFVVSFPPKYTARSPFGRGTRPMLAFDIEKGNIVFLKDYWRADVDGMDKEGDVYALLKSNRVPNIPPFGKGNDVRDHMTLTNTLREKTWACSSKEMVLLRHYRMTLDVVGRPLTSFDSSREFVSAIADAMEGKTSFAEFTHMSNSWVPQRMIMRTSMPVSFIVISARAIS